MTGADKLKLAYYRSFQGVFNVGERFMAWRKPELTTGPGSIAAIPSLLAAEGVHRPLLVTGPNIVKTIGRRIMSILDAAGYDYAVFSEVEANPSVATAERCYMLYRERLCDGFIALGGGSPMDTAKAAAARAARPDRSLAEMAGVLRVGRPTPPLIAVPTTSGTGSEATVAAVANGQRDNHKCAVMDLHLIPRRAVLERSSPWACPAHHAATGMDAKPRLRGLSLLDLQRASLRWAEDAVLGVFMNLGAPITSREISTRGEMMLAAYRAGFAFTRSAWQRPRHSPGGLYNTPHGLANAVILPIVLEDYGEAVYPKLARLAELTKLKSSGTEEAKARAFISEIRAMNRRMGIPTGFDFIKEEDIPQMVKWALAEANPVYPVPV
ncbi:MAG: iron-containing alcohol dehydrogenase, partial [Oscillospiraceae bacterium]